MTKWTTEPEVLECQWIVIPLAYLDSHKAGDQNYCFSAKKDEGS